ncbi:MAG: class I SAM-dependent methyltransferase [Thermoguttaceae bacterium]
MRQCATTLEAEMTAEEHASLLRALRTPIPEGPCLEIGTAAGGTLWKMIQCLSHRDHLRFVVVDPMRYFPGQFDTVKRNLREHGVDPDGIDFRVATSVEAFRAAQAAGETFSLVVVDASHKVLRITEDLRWLRLLRPGGVACFHDYCRDFRGIQLALNRFLSRYHNYEWMELAGSLLSLRKTRCSDRREVDLADRLYACFMHLPLLIERKITQLSLRRRQAVAEHARAA